MDGIIIAGMVAITLLIIGFIYFKGIGQEKKEQKEGDTNNVESMDLDGGEHRITYEAIMKAIEEFRNSYLFGSDSFGKVYKAILVNEGGRRENNMVVAVKFSNLLEDGKSVSRSPSHEIEALKFVHHRNIVYLLGWMRVPNMKLEIFVYEYMPKASLWEALNLAAVPVGNSELEKLNWKNHYNIVLGVAQGLKYSHHDWRPPIIHGDIKSANILLNNEYIAHVSDFGLAKVMNSEGPSTSSSVFVGSSGYMAPGEDNGGGPEYNGLVEWASHIRERNGDIIMGLVDVELRSDYEMWSSEIEKVIDVAFLCIQASPKHRPIMQQVVDMLSPPSPLLDEYRALFN
ncbi:hypothetical protein SUGI_0347010 [Cryptomeria japonica]|nr:hypothetical protein SUGI_0347010 [Cryptomeria japonica]